MEHVLVLIGSVKQTVRDLAPEINMEDWCKMVEPFISFVVTLDIRAEEGSENSIDELLGIYDTLLGLVDVEELQGQILYDEIHTIVERHISGSDTADYLTRYVVHNCNIYALTLLDDEFEEKDTETEI